MDVRRDAQSPVRPVPRSAGSALRRQGCPLAEDPIVPGCSAPGQSLPSEALLAGTDGVSRVTIRAALSPPVADGHIVKRQGIGKFGYETAPPSVQALPSPKAETAALPHVRRPHLDGDRMPLAYIVSMASPLHVNVQSEIGGTEP